MKESTDGSGARRSGSKPSPKSVRASHRWTGGHGAGTLAKRKLFKDEGKDQKGDDEGTLAVHVHVLAHVIYTCTCVHVPVVTVE